MENKIIFREMLGDIKKAADAAGNRLSKERIQELLSGLPLEKEHFELIYKYLQEQNIRVLDTEEELEEYPEEETQSLSIYVEEMLRLDQEMNEDEQELMKRVMAGESDARDRLIESYLPVICGMAEEYKEQGLPVEDLIQEGNIGLMVALGSMAELDSPAACRAHIMNSINQAMDQALEENRQSCKMNESIVNRVNHLNEAVQNLERDLEHKVTAEELSAYLEMPLEEIRDILRMSGDQIEL